ncbi:MAG: hypothetical protein WCC87_07345 [Candidatus Korobacteraceae bacterium]
MVAAFAEENKLATIVVTKAPSRLLSTGAFKVGYGYVLGLQVAGYLTWQGRLLKKQWDRPAASIGTITRGAAEKRGHQLEKAVEVVRTCSETRH